MSDRPATILLATEATARGFTSALAFRRWCGRMGVAIRKTGRKEWVATAEVDAVVLGAPPKTGNVTTDLAALARASASRTMPKPWRDHARESASSSDLSSTPASALASAERRGR